MTGALKLSVECQPMPTLEQVIGSKYEQMKNPDHLRDFA
jgi:hypothetical protein